jgi:hypothetical protein
MRVFYQARECIIGNSLRYSPEEKVLKTGVFRLLIHPPGAIPFETTVRLNVIANPRFLSLVVPIFFK